MTVFVPKTPGRAPGFFLSIHTRDNIMKLFAQGTSLDLSHPHVMGILNVTPDSFSDGGTHNSLIDAVKHANLMINAGATIIDVGGESTRPGRRKLALKKSCNVLFLWLRQLLNASKSGSRSIHPNQKSSVSQRKLALTLLMISAPFPNLALWRRLQKPVYRFV